MPEKTEKKKFFGKKRYFMGRGKNRKGDMTPEDENLWEEFARDIKKLEKEIVETAPLAPKTKIPTNNAAPAPVPPQKNLASAGPAQLDGRTDSRLRRGKIPIDGTLDLHGNTQGEAHQRLHDFLVRAHKGGKRCVLVITGKGRQTPDRPMGVLKEKLPQWLSLPPLRDIVLKLYPAAIKDGGSGAWYVYLKRDRKN